MVGCSGSGKSTLARALARATGLPLVHLDQAYWRPGWVKPGHEDWLETHAELIAQPRWILDGTHLSTLEARLAACDGVVFMDFPRSTCLWRVIKRVATSYGVVRPDSAPDCPERLDLEFLRYVWRFRSRYQPRIIAAIARHAADRPVVHLATSAEAHRFLEELSAGAPGAGPGGRADRAGP